MDLDTALGDKPAEGATATDMLRADHREVRRLFEEYASDSGEPQARKVVVRSACLALELHDTLEREVFYPALREKHGARIDAFVGAHDEVMRIVRGLRDRETFDGACDAEVKRLADLVERHAREEEDELFPQAEKLGDAWLRELGTALISRKEELTRSTKEFENPAT